ncbi:MAG: hypothetical protein Q9169_007903 [Polycauliona sp. 2 TL-2023]
MLARHVISWITYAQRPLSAKELSHALALKSGDSQLDVDDIPDVDDMASVCAGLVVVDAESDIIRLVHHTTQEYFERIRESWNPQAQSQISSACLTYISFSVFATAASRRDADYGTNSRNLSKRFVDYPFYEYAGLFWAVHSIPVQKEVSYLALPFLQNDGLLPSACDVLHTILPYRGRVLFPRYPPEKTAALHLTAWFGLFLLSQDLLDEASKKAASIVNARDAHLSTPLSRAAEKGHQAVVRLLLAQDDIEADAKDHLGQTPLARAAELGHEAVVELMLAREDVLADAKDRLGMTL